MGSFHQWIDILTVVGVFTGGIISTVVGWRLSRSDSEREKIHETLQEHGERITAAETIIDLVKATFKFK